MSTNWKNSVIRNFENKSLIYDQNCEIQKTIAHNLAADLPSKDISDILEIGCGTGNLTKYLLCLYKNKNFCITDISPAMLNIAKEKFPEKNIKWMIFDGENPDIPKTPDIPHKYDLIVANMAFQWFEDIEYALAKLSQMLKSGGSLFYTVPGENSFQEWKNTLKTLNLPSGILDFSTPKSIYKQEEMQVNYINAFDFLHSIKDIGAGHARKNYQSLNPQQIKQACNKFDKDYEGNITWHILYGRINKK